MNTLTSSLWHSSAASEACLQAASAHWRPCMEPAPQPTVASLDSDTACNHICTENSSRLVLSCGRYWTATPPAVNACTDHPSRLLLVPSWHTQHAEQSLGSAASMPSSSSGPCCPAARRACTHACAALRLPKQGARLLGGGHGLGQVIQHVVLARAAVERGHLQQGARRTIRQAATCSPQPRPAPECQPAACAGERAWCFYNVSEPGHLGLPPRCPPAVCTGRRMLLHKAYL